jgi:hypothetical protein
MTNQPISIKGKYLNNDFRIFSTCCDGIDCSACRQIVSGGLLHNRNKYTMQKVNRRTGIWQDGQFVPDEVQIASRKSIASAWRIFVSFSLLPKGEGTSQPSAMSTFV